MRFLSPKASLWVICKSLHFLVDFQYVVYFVIKIIFASNHCIRSLVNASVIRLFYRHRFISISLITLKKTKFILPAIFEICFGLTQLTLSLPESIMQTYSVVLTFDPVDEILWCGNSTETSPPVLLHGTICFSIFFFTK